MDTTFTGTLASIDAHGVVMESAGSIDPIWISFGIIATIEPTEPIDYDEE